jgi:AcrR family transcriptional regulator
MPKIVDFAARRRAIAETAAGLFILEGYHTCSLAGISRACGLGRTNFYKHFRDKEDILHFLLDAFLAPLEELAACTLSAEEGRPGERLPSLLEALLARILEGGPSSAFIVGFLLDPANTRLSCVAEALRRELGIQASIALLIERAMAEGEFEGCAPGALAWALVSLLEGAAIRGLLFGDLDREGFSQSIRLLERGLRPEAARRQPPPS